MKNYDNYDEDPWKDILKLSEEELDKLLSEVDLEDSTPYIEFGEYKNIKEFWINGNKYHFQYNEGVFSDGKTKVFDFKFKLKDHKNAPKRHDFDNQRQFEIALQKYKVGITGTGNQFKVLSVVLTLAKKLILEKNPEYITFNADEKNRQSLYSKLTNYVIKRIGNYERIYQHPIDNYELGSEEFWLKRI